MPKTLQLYHKLMGQLRQWHPKERVTRIRNMALLIRGLYLSKCVHLGKVVAQWPVEGKLPSLVNRLNRFLNNEHIEVEAWYDPLARMVVEQVGRASIRLIMDCSKVGSDYRMLMVGIAYKKRTIPLTWRTYEGGKGHIGVVEQLSLLRWVLRLLPRENAVCVLADAGFESVELLRWIRRQGWSFVIRQNGRTCVRWQGQDWVKLNQIDLTKGQTRVIGWVRVTKTHDVGWHWLVLHWATGEDDPWFLLTNCQRTARQTINIYKKRMWIEEMFGDMKGHGFDLEATCLKSAERINRLILAVCIAFVWLIALGSWIVKRGWRHFIDHKSRRDKSYFRLGLDWLARCFRLDKPVPVRFSLYF